MGVPQEEGGYLGEECRVPGEILLQLCLPRRQFLSELLEPLRGVDDNSDWDTPSNFNHECDINEPKTSVMEKEDQGVDSCTDPLPPHSSTNVVK